MGLLFNGPGSVGGASVIRRRPMFACAGAENAEPMSLSVSERTCMRIDGAM
jgi:hypothetical protein